MLNPLFVWLVAEVVAGSGSWRIVLGLGEGCYGVEWVLQKGWVARALSRAFWPPDRAWFVPLFLPLITHFMS